MYRVAVSHPFGNPNSYHAALAFHERGQLSCFHTCLFAPLGIKRRFHPDLAHAPIKTYPSRELIRLALDAAPFRSWNGRSARNIDRVGSVFDRAVSRNISARDDAIYAYEDWAHHSFLAAKEMGVSAIYDLSTSYFAETQRLCRQEAVREPELRPYFQALQEPDAKLRRKEAEIHLAGRIVSASTFVRKSIETHLGTDTPIDVIPYGADVTQAPKNWKKEDFEGPLRLIYAGKLEPQKGLHYLFQALQALPFGSYRLTLAGRWNPAYRNWMDRRFKVNYQSVGQIRHARLSELYRGHHVLVFPSLCDGFGLVLLEAAASGIPVIATDRTGAPDILSHGREGFLVPAANPGSLADALVDCLNRREKLADMGYSARKVAERLSWGRYRERIANAVLQDVEPAGAYQSLRI